MRNKLILSVAIVALFITAGFAQSTFDYDKKEFFVGFSHQRDESTSVKGFEVSAVRNLSRYFGIKGDFRRVSP